MLLTFDRVERTCRRRRYCPGCLGSLTRTVTAYCGRLICKRDQQHSGQYYEVRGWYRGRSWPFSFTVRYGGRLSLTKAIAMKVCDFSS